MSHHASIVGLQKALQHQTGEELMLRELLRTVSGANRAATPRSAVANAANSTARGDLLVRRHAFLTNAGDALV